MSRSHVDVAVAGGSMTGRGNSYDDRMRAAMDAAILEAQLVSDLEAFRRGVALGRVEADSAWEDELAERIADAGRRAAP